MRRLLLIHGGALGDCVLALHFADAVRRITAADRVVVAARSSIVHWAQRAGWIDEAVALDALVSPELHSPGRGCAAVQGSDDSEPDVIVSMLGAPHPEWRNRIGASSRAEVVVIDPREESLEGRGARHIVTQWLERLAEQCMAKGLSGPAKMTPPTLDPAAPAFRPDSAFRAVRRAALARELGVEHDRPIAIVHPGSGSVRKCPPIEVMESLVDAMVEELWATTAWMIGPDERERHGEAFHQQLARRAPVLWREDVQSAADLVAGADLYIGVDAGMTHVAAAGARRTLAIFGTTDPVVWRPVGDSCDVADFPRDARDSAWVHARVVDVRDALRACAPVREAR